MSKAFARRMKWSSITISRQDTAAVLRCQRNVIRRRGLTDSQRRNRERCGSGT